MIGTEIKVLPYGGRRNTILKLRLKLIQQGSEVLILQTSIFISLSTNVLCSLAPGEESGLALCTN